MAASVTVAEIDIGELLKASTNVLEASFVQMISFQCISRASFCILLNGQTIDISSADAISSFEASNIRKYLHSSQNVMLHNMFGCPTFCCCSNLKIISNLFVLKKSKQTRRSVLSPFLSSRLNAGLNNKQISNCLGIIITFSN